MLRLFITSIALWGLSVMAWADGIYYTSNQLQEISRNLSLGEILVGLPDGLSIYENGHFQKLTIEKKHSCITHIGYTLFTHQQRNTIGDALCNFVERFLLSTDLPLKRQKSVEQEMQEEKIAFRTGDLSTLKSLVGDTLSQVSSRVYKGKAHIIKWTKDGKTICEMGFPINHELMRGIHMEENDERLQMDVIMTFVNNVILSPSVSELSKDDDIYISKGTIFEKTSLTSDRFYSMDSHGTIQPLFSVNHAKESVANIFTDNDVANEYVLEINQKQYNYQTTTFSVPLRQWVAYYKEQGCVPYFRVVGTDGEILDCLLIMQHPQMGYCHLMRVKFDASTIETRRGTITARLNPFIPTSNVKDLNLKL